MKKQIGWSYQIRPEMSVFYGKWILNCENIASINGPRVDGRYTQSLTKPIWQGYRTPIQNQKNKNRIFYKVKFGFRYD